MLAGSALRRLRRQRGCCSRLAGWLGKRDGRQIVLLVAMVVMTIGVAHSLKLSVPLALVTFGMLARNLDRRHALLPVRFGEVGQLFFVVLFVLTGASLEFHALGVAAAGAVAAFIVLRFLGKALALLLFGRLSGIRPGGAGLLAIALLPMSGLAVVMVRDTVSLYPVVRPRAGRGGAVGGGGARAARPARHAVRAAPRRRGASRWMTGWMKPASRPRAA